jgi:hypothetical protein
VLDNLALVGGSGTQGCHGLVQALDEVACSKLRANLTEQQIAYIVQKKSLRFLDRYYPGPPPGRRPRR